MLKVLGYIWASPVTLIGLFLSLFYGVKKVSFASDGVLEFTVKRIIGQDDIVGQTWGQVIFFKPPYDMSPRIRAHERVHVRQCMILGPFVILAYPLASLVGRITDGTWYNGNWFEKKAYAETDYLPEEPVNVI